MTAEDRIDRQGAETSEEAERGPEENETFLDEELIPILVVGGLLLFLFPEPTTSALGIVLVGIGVGLWLRNVIS